MSEIIDTDDETTPLTMEEVQDTFAQCTVDGETYDEQVVKFQEWMKEHDAEVTKAVEERVIALITKSRRYPPYKVDKVNARFLWMQHHNIIIELIQGKDES